MQKTVCQKNHVFFIQIVFKNFRFEFFESILYKRITSTINSIQHPMVVQKHFFLGKVDTENSMKMVVSKFFDQPEMTKRWSRVVEKSKLYEIGHITYHFDGNCMLISKITSKMIFELTCDD